MAYGMVFCYVNYGDRIPNSKNTVAPYHSGRMPKNLLLVPYTGIVPCTVKQYRLKFSKSAARAVFSRRDP
eukprot:scaffold31547_cov137-Amphora_coffeaeformis.AAC.1